MVLMPGMVITPGHLYRGEGLSGKCRLTLPLRHEQKTAGGGGLGPFLFRLPTAKVLGQEFESVQLKVWFVNVWPCLPVDDRTAPASTYSTEI